MGTCIVRIFRNLHLNIKQLQAFHDSVDDCSCLSHTREQAWAASQQLPASAGVSLALLAMNFFRKRSPSPSWASSAPK